MGIDKLSSDFIDNLEHTNSSIIGSYIKHISREVYILSKRLKEDGCTNYHINARCEINKKYGKFWRERLDSKRIYKSRSPFGKMSYK